MLHIAGVCVCVYIGWGREPANTHTHSPQRGLNEGQEPRVFMLGSSVSFSSKSPSSCERSRFSWSVGKKNKTIKPRNSENLQDQLRTQKRQQVNIQHINPPPSLQIQFLVTLFFFSIHPDWRICFLLLVPAAAWCGFWSASLFFSQSAPWVDFF